ncbi:MAG TPA: S41 family peptidase [Candidatus Saccharimonadales bacterium]
MSDRKDATPAPTTKAVSPAPKRSGLPWHQVALVALFVGVVSFIGGTRSDELQASLNGQGSSADPDFSSLDDVYDTLKGQYDGKLDNAAIIAGAKDGLVKATGDPYTDYFTAKEAEEFNSDLSGSFQGIGAELGKKDQQLVVINTLDDSPAKKAGLLAGDAIVTVNDDDAADWSVEEAVSKIRGDAGTTVKLGIVRADELKEISITRAAITNPSVKSEVLQGNVGYLRLSRFDENTETLSRQAADTFKADGVKNVILDLRGNGGGYLDAGVGVASLWLNDKVVVSERRGNEVVETLRSDKDAPLEGIKTIVLVDGGSASASEIVAGALVDNKAATLLGQKTFGKGSVQRIVDVKGGGQLKVTVAKWYTPAGKNINKEGITPGTIVELTADDVNANRDPQKDKALQLLQAP